MGSDKALLPYQGGRFIEAIHRRMEELFEPEPHAGVPELFHVAPEPSFLVSIRCILFKYINPPGSHGKGL
jgi:hypothetical protein